MQEKESIVVSGLITLMMLLWLSFLFHYAPEFAGSTLGIVFAISGSILMLVPLVYSVIKRNRKLQQIVTKRISMRTLLAWHIYAGILGPILAIIHTGHKFHSPLAVSLTALMIVVVISGFIGRYLMKPLTNSLKEKESLLALANTEFESTLHKLSVTKSDPQLMMLFNNPLARLLLRPNASQMQDNLQLKAIGLSDTIADLEYAIGTHDLAKNTFAKWLKFHILLSSTFYLLLAGHIAGELYFGLRW
ncbi:MAG: hypothetical protein K2X81_19745 [Candidatus Obscuribacterales bacterium]|jgi:uncharacterized membrane protein YsdA (DUF1294 family)|nr:hypothetical protein [Candidatus Obscuribacterales bacterium]